MSNIITPSEIFLNYHLTNNMNQFNPLFTYLINILRDKTTNDKLMYITNKDIQKSPFCRSKLLVGKFEFETNHQLQ